MEESLLKPIYLQSNLKEEREGKIQSFKVNWIVIKTLEMKMKRGS